MHTIRSITPSYEKRNGESWEVIFSHPASVSYTIRSDQTFDEAVKLCNSLNGGSDDAVGQCATLLHTILKEVRK